MTGSRLSLLAGAAFSMTVIACGSVSTTSTQSGAPETAVGSTQTPSQTPVPLTAHVTMTGAINGTLAIDTTDSYCEILPSGNVSASFDGVLPGTEAGFSVLEPPGTETPIGDQVSVNTNFQFWHNDASGTVTIKVTGNTATGTVSALIAGQTGSGVNGSVAPLHVSASFTCPVSGSGG
jgi:hypothetical protein